MEYFWIILLLIVLLIIRFSLPFLRGKSGEAIVKMVLGKDKEGEKHIINNVTIVADGKSSQIDHILINDRGIFCIETKNYSGRIYGEADQQQWTQVLAFGKRKNKFYNPVKQNWTHVRRLSEVLGKDYPIYSVIVFVQNNIRFIKANNVVGLWGFRRYMNTIGLEGNLTSEQIDELSETVKAFKENSPVTAKEHIHEIKQMQNELQRNSCPRCGGNLILRHGKYGDFYGCSNYPNCRFTKK